MNVIIDTVTRFLPVKRRSTPSGWVSFNCVACTHNGTTADTKGRAGIRTNTNGISYSCFNCKFKASWQPGHKISRKFKSLMQWLNVPDDLINQCVLEAIKLHDNNGEYEIKKLLPEFFNRPLPESSKPIKEYIKSGNIPDDLIPVLQYIVDRGFDLDEHNFYWDEKNKDRLIIPFTYHNRIVGHTARYIHNNTKNRYISDQQSGYVFNLDAQPYDRKFAIICEGPFDALSIGGVALLGSNIANGQHNLINMLNREIIVVPDHDRNGLELAELAIDYGWSVSFPEWEPGIKDINQAVLKYGRLYTLYSIIKAKQEDQFKIELYTKLQKTKWNTK